MQPLTQGGRQYLKRFVQFATLVAVFSHVQKTPVKVLENFSSRNGK